MEAYPFRLTNPSNWEYTFITKDKISYEVGFCEFSNKVKTLLEEPIPEIYEVYLYPIIGEPKGFDFRVMNTFCEICVSFMKTNLAIYYTCDTEDDKQGKRQQLFERKFYQFCDENSEYKMISRTTEYQDKTYFSAIISSCYNPHFWRFENLLMKLSKDYIE